MRPTGYNYNCSYLFDRLFTRCPFSRSCHRTFTSLSAITSHIKSKACLFEVTEPQLAKAVNQADVGKTISTTLPSCTLRHSSYNRSIISDTSTETGVSFHCPCFEGPSACSKAIHGSFKALPDLIAHLETSRCPGNEESLRLVAEIIQLALNSTTGQTIAFLCWAPLANLNRRDNHSGTTCYGTQSYCSASTISYWMHLNGSHITQAFHI